MIRPHIQALADKTTSPAIRRWGACIVLAGLLSAVLVTEARAQFDDFDDGDDDGWTRYDPLGGLGAGPIADWTFPSGAMRIRSDFSPDPGLAGPSRAASLRLDTPYSGFCVTVDIVDWDTQIEQSFGILARVQPNPGLGTTSGYAVTWQADDQDVQISRIDDEVPTDISGLASALLEPGRTYRLVFMGDGSYLEARIYELPDLVNPLVTLAAIDATWSDGHCGIVVYDNSSGGTGTTDATFDNYHATDLTPPNVDIRATASDEFELSWDAAPFCYELESAPSPGNSAPWSRVTSGIVLSDGRFHLGGTTNGASRFYRLRRFGG